MTTFELVIPCYNEAKNLPILVNRCVECAKNYGYDPQTFTLTLVENGSLDHSKEVLHTLLNSPLKPWLNVVWVPINSGYGYGLWRGLKHAKASTVGYTHADLQCDPENAFKAAKLLENPDSPLTLIKGYRRHRPFQKKLVSRIFEGLAYMLLGTKVLEINAQPKVFPQRLLLEVKAPPSSFSFDLYLLYRAQKAGYKLKSLFVEFPARIHGHSSWARGLKSQFKTFAAMFLYICKLAKTEGRR